MNIRELLEKFAEEVAESSYDTHGEGCEQREIEDIVNEYVDTFTNGINAELDKLENENSGTGLEEGEEGAWINGYGEAINAIRNFIKE